MTLTHDWHTYTLSEVFERKVVLNTDQVAYDCGLVHRSGKHAGEPDVAFDRPHERENRSD